METKYEEPFSKMQKAPFLKGWFPMSVPSSELIFWKSAIHEYVNVYSPIYAYILRAFFGNTINKPRIDL